MKETLFLISLFSEEATFNLNGSVSRRNCVCWATEYLRVTEERTVIPREVLVWCGLPSGKLIGHFALNQLSQVPPTYQRCREHCTHHRQLIFGESVTLNRMVLRHLTTMTREMFSVFIFLADGYGMEEGRSVHFELPT
jgi:hypothetical protein